MYLFAVPLKVGETDFRFFVRYLVLPSHLDRVLEMPWTILTHFMLHTGFFKLLFHIIFLGIFGKLFFEFWHSTRFIILLLLSSLLGALAFIFITWLLPALAVGHSEATLSGAGAAVFGLVFYMMVYLPDHSFVYMMLIRIKMKYLILLFIVVDLMITGFQTPAVYFAHVGGALFGLCFAGVSKFFKHRLRTKLDFKAKRSTAKKQGPVRTKTDEEYNMLKKQRQDKLDAILEKISRSGYGSLSQEEKDFLFIESKK